MLEENEYQAQCAVIQWAAYQEHHFPELQLLKGNLEGIYLHGTQEQRAKTINKAKKAGMRPGWPDLELPVSRKGYGALFIELKVGTNKPSPEQVRMLDLLVEHGNAVYLAYGSQQAIKIISSYLSKK